MAISNYTYLKLKMSGPASIIIVGPTHRHAYECDVECVEYAKALVESEALIVDLENLIGEVPDPKRHASSFKLDEATKSIPSTLAALVRRRCRSAPSSTLNRKKCSSTSSAQMTGYLRGVPQNMPIILREVVEHSLGICVGSRPVRQHLCQFDEEKRRVIWEEVHVLLAVGFTKEVFHTEWLVNIILVRKKGG
jgi:hypothetical protein